MKDASADISVAIEINVNTLYSPTSDTCLVSQFSVLSYFSTVGLVGKHDITDHCMLVHVCPFLQ